MDVPTIIVKREREDLISVKGKNFSVSERINKHSEELKQLGGKWNARKGCWILPYSNILKVKSVVDSVINEIEQSKIKKPSNRKCSICRQTGHNRSTCPNIDAIH